jgi:hypothetical protein
MPPSTPASTSRAASNCRENSALCYRVRQLEQSLDRATTVLLQSERERVDTRLELLHVKKDIRRLSASQNRLNDKLQRKDDLLTVRAHLLGCELIKVEKLEKTGQRTSPT